MLKSLFIIGLLFLSNMITAQAWEQLGSEINGTSANDILGRPISMNSTGTIMAVGMKGHDDNASNSGAVQVFEWDEGDQEWEQMGDEIYGEGVGEGAGNLSVDLSSDGSVLVIGSTYNNGNGNLAGHVRIFDWNEGGPQWVQRGIDIDGTTGDQFGHKVSISSDGTIVSAGALWGDTDNGEGSGYVGVYEWNEGSSSWVQKGLNIDGGSADDRIGSVLSMNADGTILAVGSTRASNFKGQVKIYEWNDGTASWIQQGMTFEGDEQDHLFGNAISLNANGDILAIGAPIDLLEWDDVNGYVQIHQWNGVDAWNQIGEDIVSDIEYDEFGSSVSLNESGTIAVVGAPGTPTDTPLNAGQVRTYQWIDNSTWEQQDVIDGWGENDFIGANIHLNNDGSILAIGAINNDTGGSNAGQIRMFEYPYLNYKPTFTPGADQTVPEEAGEQIVAGWATNISDGNDEEVQTLNFILSTTNDDLFAVLPSINAETGDLSYTLAEGANGSATVTVLLSDNRSSYLDGNNTSDEVSFTIAGNPVNGIPTFTKGPDINIGTAVGERTFFNWATDISDGDDEVEQTLTFEIIHNTNPAFFGTGAPATIDQNGTLTLTPGPGYIGSTILTIVLKDDGGEDAGGMDTSVEQTFEIVANDINDGPFFTVGTDHVVNEDAGGQVVNNWATGINDGDGELVQALNFEITGNTNPALFSSQPAISADGTLTYTSSDNANGTASVTIQLSDDGGTDNGGVDVSNEYTFSITVNAVNDAPSFTVNSDHEVNEDSGPQSVANWMTEINDGDEEVEQTLTLVLTNNSNNDLFEVGPSIDDEGTLTYTPTPNISGSSMITYHIMDDGGTDNSGVDTSEEQSFTITIIGINDQPYFTLEGENDIVAENSSERKAIKWVSEVNDGDPEKTQNLSFELTNDNENLFAVQPSISVADEELTYTLAENMTGTATVTVVLTDDGGTELGGEDTTEEQVFSITVVEQPWKQIGTAITDNNDGNYNIGPFIQLSADGTTMITSGDNSYLGALRNDVRVYEWNEGASDWTQKGSLIQGEPIWNYYNFPAINEDGTVVAIGSPENDGGGSNSGNVRVYQWNQDSEDWEQKGAGINGKSSGDYAGLDLALSADGSIVAMISPTDFGNSNKLSYAQIFEWNDTNDTWEQKGDDILAETAEDYIGKISLSADGEKAAIGSEGSVRVYEWFEGAWIQQGQSLESASYSEFGLSLSMSLDGKKVAIGGAPSEQVTLNETGFVRIFEWSEDDNSWYQLGADIEGENENYKFGGSLSMNTDGTKISVGSNGNDGNGRNSGSITIYEWDEGAWQQIGADIDGESETDHFEFGYTHSMSADGGRVAGAANTEGGSLRVFELENSVPGNSCSNPKVLNNDGVFTVDNTSGNDWFEYTVPKDGITFIVASHLSEEDTYIEVYDEDCTTLLASNDDYWGLVSGLIQLNSEAGRVLRILFDDRLTTTSYEVDIFTVASANGLTCDDPIDVAVGLNEVNNHLGNRWYSYIFPADGDITVSSCNTTTEDTYLSVYSDCSTFLAEDDDSDCGNGSQSSYTYSGESGEQVFFAWNNLFTGAVYDFEASFSSTDPCTPDMIDTVVSACDSYTFDDVEYFEGGEYQATFTNEVGCDSLVNLTLTILESEVNDVEEEVCGSYIFDDIEYFESGEYQATFTNEVGCDSLVNLTLTILESEVNDVEEGVCGSYTFDDIEYFESGEYQATFTNEVGCDSLVNLTLTILESEVNDVEEEVCGSYTFDDIEYFESGEYQATFINEVGCDSLVNLTLTILESEVNDVEEEVCGSYIFDDIEYFESGEYQATFTNEVGCDSLVNLTLTILESEVNDVEEEVCGSYIFDDIEYFESGEYQATFTNEVGCDSLVNLSLTILESEVNDVEEEVCGSYTFDDIEYFESGEYQATFINEVGCDSLVNLTLTILESEVNDVEEEVCGSYIFDDIEYFESGEYQATFTNEVGCDSLVNLTLTILESEVNDVEEEVCGSYIFDDIEYFESGEYQATFTNEVGCDSLVNLTLTILESEVNDVEEEVCSSYTFDDIEYFESGEYQATFTNEVGCDSLVNLTLTILESEVNDVEEGVCGSYTFDDIEYFESGEYQATFTNEVGCDSLVNLSLTILESEVNDVEEEVCGSYTFDDIEYFESGEYQATFTNEVGCDSLVNLTLTILESEVNDVEERACNSYTFDDIEYFESGEYQATFTNEVGCDSLVNLRLTILESEVNDVEEEACVSYTFDDIEYFESGEYQATFTNEAGCDSLVNLNLRILEKPSSNISLNGVILFADEQDGMTYQWVDCETNEALDGENDRQFSPKRAGSYAVEISNEHCTVISECMNSNGVILSVKEDHLPIRAYPIPTREKVNIDLGQSYPKVKVQLISLTGEVLESSEYISTKHIVISLNQKTGIYFLRISAGQHHLQTIRVIKD